MLLQARHSYYVFFFFEKDCDFMNVTILDLDFDMYECGFVFSDVALKIFVSDIIMGYFYYKASLLFLIIFSHQLSHKFDMNVDYILP